MYTILHCKLIQELKNSFTQEISQMKFLFISPRFSGGIGGHAAMLAKKLTQKWSSSKEIRNYSFTN